MGFWPVFLHSGETARLMNAPMGRHAFAVLKQSDGFVGQAHVQLLVDELVNRVVLDPNQQVQKSLRHLFATFVRNGSAWSTVQAFRREGVNFPRRGQAGAGEILWCQLTHAVVLATLHNPRYAGAFCFGRTRTWRDPDGHWHCQRLPGNNGDLLNKTSIPAI
jgi:hypothetical protein